MCDISSSDLGAMESELGKLRRVLGDLVTILQDLPADILRHRPEGPPREVEPGPCSFCQSSAS
jgi:hypothetical protein